LECWNVVDVFLWTAEAYLCQSEYVAALITCLRAVEQNNPALLADVNPALVCVFFQYCVITESVVYHFVHSSY